MPRGTASPSSTPVSRSRIAVSIGAELAAFLQGAVGIVVASRDARLLPSIGRAVGCRVDREAGSVTVFLVPSENAALLADLRASGRIAAVFSEPSSHRTVQVKGCDARERAVDASDRDAMSIYAGALDAELASIGFGDGYARALIAHEPSDLVGVEFTVAEAFVQTPGPRAGEPLAST